MEIYKFFFLPVFNTLFNCPVDTKQNKEWALAPLGKRKECYSFSVHRSDHVEIWNINKVKGYEKVLYYIIFQTWLSH